MPKDAQSFTLALMNFIPRTVAEGVGVDQTVERYADVPGRTRNPAVNPA